MGISRIIESSFRRFACFAAAAAVICLFTGVQVCAQLQVTEVMVNPMDENVWEWIEVYNPDGVPIDLHGAFGDRLGDPSILSGDPPSIDNAKAFNTVIPAGGVAVLYDANLPLDGTDFEDLVFRNAWELSGTVPLIGVDFFPTLINSGSSIGFWEDYTAYEQDVVDPGPGNLVVGSFDHALFGIDFRSGFPVTPNGTSMRWNGQGSYQSGVNWTLSSSGVHGGVTSMPASVQGPINSTSDLASPGVRPAGGFRTALIITELMVSPASDEPDWEWIEVFNGTGALIDFADPNMNYVLDDTDGADLIEANITSGSIGNSETAVLYNGDALSFQNIQDAWDPNGSNDTNFIPVSNFSELATSGTVALWKSLTDYLTEPMTELGRSTDNAFSVLNYEDVGDWPMFNGVSSNYLTDLNADPNGPGYGFSWEQSDPNDDGISFHASEVLGGVPFHAGGDVGSPGAFDPNDADFDDDNDVDGVDFLIWQRGLGVGSTHADGDANRDNVVDAADLAIWEAQYGIPLPLSAPLSASSAVPEPASTVLLLLGLACLGGYRARGRAGSLRN